MPKSDKKEVIPPKTFPPSVISKEGEFQITDKHICEVWRAHGPKEGEIDTELMIVRGVTVGAGMFMRYGDFLLKHRDKIPPKYADTTFLFPMENILQDDKSENGFVRLLEKEKEGWWCLVKLPAKRRWDDSHKLVRFRPDLPALLPAKTDP